MLESQSILIAVLPLFESSEGSMAVWFIELPL